MGKEHAYHAIVLNSGRRNTVAVPCVNEIGACGEVINTEASLNVTHAVPFRKTPAGIQHKRSHLHTTIRLHFHVKQII